MPVGREQRLDFPPEGGVLPAGFSQETFAASRGLLRQRLREYSANAFVHTVLAIRNQLGPTTPLLVPHSFMRLLLAFSLSWRAKISQAGGLPVLLFETSRPARTPSLGLLGQLLPELASFTGWVNGNRFRRRGHHRHEDDCANDKGDDTELIGDFLLATEGFSTFLKVFGFHKSCGW